MSFERITIESEVRLSALTMGEGPLILCAHGFPGLSLCYEAQLKTFASAGYRVVAPDMRGYGRSERPRQVEAYEARRISDDILAILDHFGEETAVLIGHDFGARAIFGFALHHPSRARALISLGVPYGAQFHGAQAKEESASGKGRRRLPSEVFRSIAEKHFFHMHYFQERGRAERDLAKAPGDFLARLYFALSARGKLLDMRQFPSDGTSYLDVLAPAPSPFAIDGLDEEALGRIVVEYTSVDDSDLFFIGGLNAYRVMDLDAVNDAEYAMAPLPQPALFLGGARDPVRSILNERSIASMRDRLPGLVAIEWIEGAGHLVHIERAEAVNRAILAFLNQLR